jgi:carboxymethylenebutenolidase
MNSQWIDLDAADGGRFGSYLSLPPAGKGPGILLIQEIFGVNGHIRAVADQYALDGCVVLAPDLFWRLEPRLDIGYSPPEMERGMGLAKRFDFPRGLDDLAATVAALRARPECNGKVAAIGYCMGGTLSFLCAAKIAVDAAVCYYPGGIDRQLEQAASVKCPLLVHFAGNDKSIGPAAVEAVQKAFAGRANAAFHVYPGAAHGFNCWARAAYNQPAALLAHGRTLEFLAGPLAR